MEGYTLMDKISPDYYQKGNIEVTDFIIDQSMSFLEGNIVNTWLDIRRSLELRT